MTKRLVPALLSLLAFACSAAPATEEESGSGAALSTGVAEARACAVRDAYLNADASAFTFVDASSLPAAVAAKVKTASVGDPLEALAEFTVSSFGKVLVLEQDYEGDSTSLTFLSASTGDDIAVAGSDNGATMSFGRNVTAGSNLIGKVLTCGSTQPAGTGPILGGADAGADAGADPSNDDDDDTTADAGADAG